MKMASEKQIAANRRNARKSTGPRSRAGKGRASQNAYRHGLNLSIASSAEFANRLDGLARKIAGNTKDATILERARTVAEAHLDLTRVRRTKVALIARVLAFGDLTPSQPFSAAEAIRCLKALERGLVTSMPESIDPSATMPAHEPDRTGEALRRVLPELMMLERYERRASARRDRAVLRFRR